MSFTTFNIPWKKIKLVLLNSLNNLIAPVFTVVISILVVRLSSIGLWGEYARVILLITFLSQIVAWGNKEYLSREFSKYPKDIDSIWSESLISRSIFLLPLFIFIGLLPSTGLIKLYLAIILSLRFIFQSYDSILLFKRNYPLRITLECIHGIIFATVVILFQKQLTIERIIFLTIIIDFSKTLAVIFFVRIKIQKTLFSVKHLKRSFLFFLLMFTSLMASRIDQVNAALFLEDSEMGEYQILMSFLLIIQASSNFILQPFVKNIYRLKLHTVKKIAWKLFLIGIPIVAFGSIAMYFMMSLLYQIEMSFTLLLLSYLFTLPIFYYSPYIYHLYKNEKIAFVIGMNIGGSIVLFVSSVILMNFYGKGIFVILLPAGVVQCLTLIVYFKYSPIKKTSPLS